MADEDPLSRKRKRQIFITRKFKTSSNRNNLTNQKKVLNSIQLPTSNRFAALQNSNDASAMDTGDQQQQQLQRNQPYHLSSSPTMKLTFKQW